MPSAFCSVREQNHQLKFNKGSEMSINQICQMLKASDIDMQRLAVLVTLKELVGLMWLTRLNAMRNALQHSLWKSTHSEMNFTYLRAQGLKFSTNTSFFFKCTQSVNLSNFRNRWPSLICCICCGDPAMNWWSYLSYLGGR